MTSPEKKWTAIFNAERSAVLTAMVAAAFVLGVVIFWHGFGPRDEGHYVRAAFRWLEEGPYLGDTHWALRHLFVMPIAGSFVVFGPSVFSATLPNIVFAGGLIALTWFFGRRYLGLVEAFVASVLIAFSPFFMARPIELDVYGAEVFFIALAVWLFVAAQFERRVLALLFAAGLCAGFAWSLREVSVSSIIGLGALALVFHRKRFWQASLALGAGFALVPALELILYSVAAGDPFYRYRIDLGHTGASISSQPKGPPPSAFDWFILPFKDMATYPMTAPFVVLAILTAVAFRGEIRAMALSARRPMLNFLVVSAFALPVSAWVLHLAMPHYYPIVAYTAYLTFGVGVALAARRFGPWAGGLLALLVLATNFAAEDFRNYDDYAEPEYLASQINDFDEPVYTDFITAKRAKMLLRLRGDANDLDAKIVGVATPPTGGLFFEAHPRPLLPINPAWCR
ncbi:MAG: glycosyltransferase family 39 protein [Parvularculaceae bacterium]